jgi:hypothetical protein
MGCKSNRGIFGVDPAKQRAAFFGCRSYQSNAGRGWQKRDRRWINNLKNIKADGVRH